MTSRRDFLKGCAGLTGVTVSGGLISSPLRIGSFAAASDAGDSAGDSELGKPLSPWRSGTMEFHHIYTGWGESIFHLFPDGTSLLIDAGRLYRPGYALRCETLPNESREPGEWIARYVERVNPHGAEVDYMMISHFHSDHFGSMKIHSGRTQGRGEDYFLSGMTRVGETIHFQKGFDRGFPDYDRPLPIDDEDVANYRRFLRWKEKEDGLTMEPFEVGRLDQIALVRNPEPFARDFHVRNLFGSGVLWTGRENETDDSPAVSFQKSGQPTENPLSLGLRIDYGPFRYYTGGDFNGFYEAADGTKRNLEDQMGPICGRVDVAKSNHHSYLRSMSPGFLREIAPRVFVTDIWDQLHIQPSTMTSMSDETLYPGPRLICPTNFPPQKKEEFAGAPWRLSVAEEGGHVIIRILDGGRRFKVYYVTARDESMIVKSVYGPFETSEK